MDEPRKLFISHAAADAQAVDEFVDLLESGIGVPADDIFCTSRRGQSIPAGANFTESIRARLNDATTVLALISPNFYASAFCMCELGASWVLAHNFIPVLVPPASYRDMKAVLNGLQALKLDDPEHLDELKDTLTERLGLKPSPTPRWTKKRDRFRKQLPKALKSTSPPSTVERAKLDLAVKERDEYAEAFATAEQDRDELREQLKKVSALKDRAQVRAISEEHSDSHDAFEALIEEAKDALGKIYPITREALCWSYTARGDEFDLNSKVHEFDHDDANRAGQYKELTLYASTAEPNLHNNKVQKTSDALERLATWIRNAPSEFHEDFAEEHDQNLDLGDRGFWDTFLSL